VQLLRTFSYQAATALSRVRLYAQVKQHAIQLERKVAKRTKEIQDVHEAQKQMIVDLTHNLQTPLAILKSKVDHLRKTMVHDRELTTLDQSVDALSSFIYDLMAIANLEQALKQEERTTFSLSQVIEEVVEEVSVVADARGVRVESDVSHEIEIVGNERRIREAVMNLASNALKYLRERGPKEVRFVLQIQESHAVLSIIDTGIGIPAADIPHIFERFYRGSAKVYGKTPGTGLGLSIVERIVKDHGGTAAVESEEGAGTTVTLRFPLPAIRS
jgi:signal transduction histidine kinase